MRRRSKENILKLNSGNYYSLHSGVNAPPLCGTTSGYMGWESPGGTTHFAPPSFHYEAAYSPVIVSPTNGTAAAATAGLCEPHHTPLCSQGVLAAEGGRGQQPQQHTVHFHVQPGEAVSLQLGEQVQTIQVLLRVFVYRSKKLIFPPFPRWKFFPSRETSILTVLLNPPALFWQCCRSGPVLDRIRSRLIISYQTGSGSYLVKCTEQLISKFLNS